MPKRRTTDTTGAGKQPRLERSAGSTNQSDNVSPTQPELGSETGEGSQQPQPSIEDAFVQALDRFSDLMVNRIAEKLQPSNLMSF